MRGIHRSPVNSPHKGQWRGALMFSLICIWINGWLNNREAGDLRRDRAHYDVIVMMLGYLCYCQACPLTTHYGFIIELRLKNKFFPLNLKSKYKGVSFSWKCISLCRLRNSIHFVSASTFYFWHDWSSVARLKMRIDLTPSNSKCWKKSKPILAC